MYKPIIFKAFKISIIITTLNFIFDFIHMLTGSEEFSLKRLFLRFLFFFIVGLLYYSLFFFISHAKEKKIKENKEN